MTTPPEYEQLLHDRYGSFLRTVRYQSQGDHLCPICGGIKQKGYDYCYSCTVLSSANKLPITRPALGFYAVEEMRQFYTVVHDYKELATPNTQQSRGSYTALIALILTVDVKNHLNCIRQLAGTDITAWATIPSSKGSKRAGRQHPLNKIVRGLLGDTFPEVRLVATGEKQRGIDPHEFALAGGEQPSLNHVLLIDDSWVTGGSIQSAALALKSGGAKHISAYCIARVAATRYLEQILGPKGPHRFMTALKYESGWCPWHRRIETTRTTSFATEHS